MSESDVKYMTEAIAADMSNLLTKDFGMTIPEALDALYNSATYDLLIDPRTGLYFQSSLYVYSFLKNELKSGKIA